MDSAGSSDAEFVMEAMKIDDAHALQQFVRSQQQGSNVVVKETNATETQSLLTMRTKDFLKLCISENHLKSLVLIATFVLGKAYDFSQQLGLDSKRYIEEQSSGVAVSIWAISILLSLALGIAILFSTIRVIIRFYDYRLQHTSTAFEMSWGLFTRHRKTMPYTKVEFITWVANWLRQKMDMMVLRLHSLAESETEQALHIQMPVTNKKMFAHITDTYIPLMPAEAVNTPAGIEKAYVYRKLLMIGLPITLIAGTIIWFNAGWHAGWVLLWLLYFVASQYTFYKNYRIWITEDAIQISRGIWGSEQVVIYLDKIVSVAQHTSPYQRSNGYANLVLHMPGKSWVIPYLSREQADYWMDYITMKIEA
jgi:putative membrane protein